MTGHWSRLFLLLVVAACHVCNSAIAQNNSSTDRDLVVETFKTRMEHAKNLYYKCEIKVDVYEDRNGKPGDLIEACPSQKYEYWQLNDSNRQEAVYTSEDGTKVTYGANFDAEQGQGATRSSTDDGERYFGYINSERDKTMTANRYRFWLNVRDWGLGSSEYIFNYVIDHQDSLEVETGEANSLEVSTDYTMMSMFGSGKRLLWLDKAKGLMPIRGDFEWKDDEGASRREIFEVLDSKLVETVWMPTEITEHITVGFDDGTSIHNLITIKVTEIEHGGVTSADLDLGFPRNTQFVDAIKGVFYKGDEHGNPIGPVMPVMQQVPLEEPPKSFSRWSKIYLVVGSALVFAGLLFFRRYNDKKAGR